MKTKRRMTAIALAACMLGSAAPLGVSAAEYNVLYDVNRDGTVSITDTISLNQYLMGYYYVDDPSIMDTDQNLVVNCVDAERIAAYLTDSSFTAFYISEPEQPTEAPTES